MFEQFSRGYYLGRLYVEPRDDETARMCTDQYRRVADQLYGDDGPRTGGEPLVMKLGTRHFPVHGEDDVPADTLAVPPTVLEDTDVANPPSLREVLLATADRATQLLRLTGGAEPGPTDDQHGPGGPGGPDGPAGI